MRLLIANRGEIARRIIRTAHQLGHETVAVFADPDCAAPFVNEATHSIRLGPADLALSYLSIDALIAALTITGADAVHPGYGFLSERADFARAVIAAGARWIGPNPDAIDRMGSKIEARRLATAAGVPIIPGFDASQDRAELIAAAARIGYPVLVKASAGGGGKGIRIAHDQSEIERSLDDASTEAMRSFGNGDLIVERYVQRPRHVEVQVVGDKHGNVIHLGTRECSLQRRYQKIIEEAPAPNLPEATRAGLCRDAVALARSIGYDSAGTVEFVVDDETGEYFFLEVNTRLQVEHPVTEFVTGLDLVALQLGSAEDMPLPLTQDEVTFRGHAIEARVNAEDPWSGFMPQTGTIRAVRIPTAAHLGVRWDAAVEDGSVISPFYDSMLAKLIVHGTDRENARRKIVAALDQLIVAGLSTNTGFVRWLLDHPTVTAGRVTTRFLDETALPAPPDPVRAATIAARVWQRARDDSRSDADTWQRIGAFRLTPHRQAQSVALVRDSDTFDVAVDAAALHGHTPPVSSVVDLAARWVAVNVDGTTFTFDVPSRQTRWITTGAGSAAAAGSVVAPFPAMVVEVRVGPGDVVQEGQVLVVIEAMKMLHSLVAKGSGTVDEVRVAPGQQVESHKVLVTFVTATS